MLKHGSHGQVARHRKAGEPLCQECCEFQKNFSRRYYLANAEKMKAKAKENYQQNKDRRRETGKAWQQANLEKVRSYNRKAYAKNPDSALRRVHRRKARIRGNGYKPYTLEQVLEKYGAICHLCETSIDLTLPRKIGVEGWEYGLHLDHIIPLVKGGPDTLENVAPAHAICNLEKRGNECLKKVAI
jgi:5-methylcytosine-specific restriction endonuclease McrA